MPYTAAIFDLDGTLVDSLRDIADAANHALTRMGLPTHPLPRYKSFAGQGLPNLFRAALGPGAQDRLDEAVALFKPYYAEHKYDTTGPYAGIPDMLESLHHAGVRLGVLSNKPDPVTRDVVDALFGGVPWHAVRGHRAGYAPKPDPASCFELLEELDAAPRATAFIGDTMADMLTATATGCFAVGVSWGFRSVEELETNGAAAVVHHPRELVGLLLSEAGAER